MNRHPATVGWCYRRTPTQETLEAFYRSESGKITRLRFPGARFTEATALNDQHVVVGWYEDQGGAPHSFIWQRSTNQYTRLDTPFPEATVIFPVAITNVGRYRGGDVHTPGHPQCGAPGGGSGPG